MQVGYMFTLSFICTDVQLKMSLTLFVQSSIFIVVVFHALHVWLVHVCVPFLLLNICCCDVLGADAVSGFMTYDAPDRPMQLSADFEYVKYMAPSAAWNRMDFVVPFKLLRCVCWPHIGPNDTKIYFHVLCSKRHVSVFA